MLLSRCEAKLYEDVTGTARVEGRPRYSSPKPSGESLLHRIDAATDLDCVLSDRLRFNVGEPLHKIVRA
jgi:hypothetical protein